LTSLDENIDQKSNLIKILAPYNIG